MKKRKILKILIICFSVYIIYSYFSNNIVVDNIGKCSNSLYEGTGQVKVKNKDGYSTIFVTKENRKFIEYKQNGDASWSQNEYWSGTMEENGCGITALSIILSGYGIEYTPEDLRQKYKPHLNGNDISKALKDDFGIENSDFYYASIYFSKNYIMNKLEEGNIILVCVWDKPNDVWTKKSHYMVLLASDGEDKIYVSNPNGTNKENPSGWYETNKILPYIAKALFIE